MTQLRATCFVVLAGCFSQGTDREPPSQPSFPQCPTAECGVATPIASASELAAIINATGNWVGFGEYTTGCLYASANIQVTGTIALDGATLNTPEQCSDCEPGAKFMSRDEPAGVTCIGIEHYWDFSTCDAIELTDTTVRLRMVERDIHPAAPNWLPIVEVMPACETACAPDQYACTATKACWSTARDYCAYCLNGTNEQCACWDDGVQADGTQCSFYATGDIVDSGTCQQGTCVVE